MKNINQQKHLRFQAKANNLFDLNLALKKDQNLFWIKILQQLETRNLSKHKATLSNVAYHEPWIYPKPSFLYQPKKHTFLILALAHLSYGLVNLNTLCHLKT